MANTPNVDAKATFPEAARPAAMPIMFCSAMPTSTNLSGQTFWKSEVFVDPARSASRTTTSGFSSASSARALP